MESLQKVKNKTTIYGAAVPLLGIYPKKMKILSKRDICTPMFIATLYTIARI